MHINSYKLQYLTKFFTMKNWWFLLLFLYSNYTFSQLNIVDYENPKKYELGGITFSGVQYLDEGVLTNICGLQIGDSIYIPGEKISTAIQKLWDQGLFSNISVSINKIIGNTVFLTFELQERPRLSKFSFSGISKGEADDIREKIRLVKGNQVTENTLSTTKYIIRKHFYEKGYFNCKVDVKQTPDTILANHVILNYIIEKGNKFKINQIDFIGQGIYKGYKLIDSSKITNPSYFFIFKRSPYINLRTAMKDTKIKKWYRLFKTSRYFEDKFSDDKQKVIESSIALVFEMQKLLKTLVFITSKKTIGIKIWIEAGHKFYLRNIKWIGNAKYSTDTLNYFFGIKKGDVYNQKLIENRLFYDQNSVNSLYQDNGYLFFNVVPIETVVEGDSIDLELRIFEGKQATINNVKITGNTKTNDHVISCREHIRKPGELYSRSDVMRTIRGLAAPSIF